MAPAIETAMSQDVSSGNVVETAIVPVLAPIPVQPRWPRETDLVTPPARPRRVGLTLQTSLLHDIIHRTFDKIQASLLFHNSFLDAHDIPVLISKFLVSMAAKSPMPVAVDIHECLLADVEYMDQMHILVSPLTLKYSTTNSIVASCLHSSLLGLGKRALQHGHIFCILDYWRHRCHCLTCPVIGPMGRTTKSSVCKDY